MRKFATFVLCAAFLLPIAIRAEGVPTQKAIQAAINAFCQRTHSAEAPGIKSIDFATEDADTLLVAINFQNGGFIVLSAEDAISPVLAYSFDNSLDINDMQQGASYWISLYKHQIAEARQQRLEATPEIAAEWQALATKAGGSRSVVVPPLLKSNWNQTRYYNDLCPEDPASNYGGHVPCGCVAVAMAMVIHYYQYPQTAQGTHEYYTNYGDLSVDFGNQSYNYNAMPNALTSRCNEVARLIYHCGVAVEMNYGTNGSGAYTENAADALEYNYKYSPEITTEYRSDWWKYSDAAWMNLLKGNLDNRQPIIYSGHGNAGNHAFVCDGYDSDNLFHFNFGWGGSGNGFFTVATNGSNAVGGFSDNQCIIYNIRPPQSSYPEYCAGTRVITASQGVIEDGSGNLDFQNFTDCTFIIAPTNGDRVQITVKALDTEEGHDFLKIWDGDPDNGGTLVESLSGNTFSPSTPYTCNSGTAYLRFTSDDDVTGDGWQVSYRCYRHVQCTGTTTLTAPSGTFEDGSGDEEYASDAYCTWKITPPNATYITLNFNEFNLSPEDNVLVYDGFGSDASLLGEFTGSDLPANLYSSTGKMRVVFITDNLYQLDGWSASYTSDGTENSEDAITEPENEDFDIFPNPAQSKIRLTIPSAFRNGTLCIRDMAGRTVLQQDIASVFQSEISINDLLSGVYIINITNSHDVLAKKLVISR